MCPNQPAPLVCQRRPFLQAIRQRYRHVEVVEAAAAREPGCITINVHQDFARSSVYWESDYVPESVTPRKVPAVTLNQLHAERAFEGPILLKLDVQGAELDVLAGSDHVLPLPTPSVPSDTELA